MNRMRDPASTAATSMPAEGHCTHGADSRAVALRDMCTADLDAVMQIEQRAYSFPWTWGNFTDSLAAGYTARLLLAAVPTSPRRRAEVPPLLGYFVAMPGVEEMHLLNLTVAPEVQGQGHARTLLAHLAAHSRERGATMLWLEVRESNQRARRLYQRWGFVDVGRRKAYYPDGLGRREDAIVMRMSLDNGSEAGDALD